MSPLRQVVLAGLLAVAALILVFFTGTRPDDADLADDRRTESSMGPEAAMRIEAAEEEQAADPSEQPVAALEGTGSAASAKPQRVTIRVVDRGGEPIPGAMLLVARHRDGQLDGLTHTTTEDDGRHGFDDIVLGSDTVQVQSASDSLTKAILTPPIPITSEVQTVRAEQVRRVRRRYVDAETGRPLEVARAVAKDELRGGGDAEAWVDVLAGYHLEDHTGWSSFRTRVSPPDGHVYWDDDLWSQALSAYANELDVVVPLRQTVDVRLTVLAYDGSPASDAKVHEFRIGSKSKLRPESMRDGFGTVHVKGVPFFRRELITFRIGIPDTTAERTLELRMGTDASQPLTGSVQLPEPDPTMGEAPFTNSRIGIGGGGRSGSFRTRGGGPRGHAEVRVTRHDGTPVVGGKVRIGYKSAITNARGVAVIKDLRVGEHPVKVTQRGLLFTTGTVTVTAGVTEALALQEGKGATVVLEVVDDLGEPLPFARFVAQVKGERVSYIDEQKGVQRVDRYVDHRGRRTITRIDPRVTEIRVYWASRSKKVPVSVSEGKRLPLRVVLPAPRQSR
ncbi:MAG: hypothetical protein QNJ98_02210 [Planctomycetota bacterium]|nr:hypothetical protein [Planctomycetota bacterium]